VNRRFDFLLEAVIKVVVDLLDQLLVVEAVEVKFACIAHVSCLRGFLVESQNSLSALPRRRSGATSACRKATANARGQTNKSAWLGVLLQGGI
jgi:hypothetical protein